jgi:mannose-6-phosphate isomerase-like protein (cupin superfamily)
MKLPIVKHEDNRRTLIEWVKDFPIRTCKVLIVKEDSVLGAHYHNNKVDTFYLLKGSGEYKMGSDEWQELKEEDCVRAELKVPHSFKLKAGSILLEASTTPYDKEDEIPLT